MAAAAAEAAEAADAVPPDVAGDIMEARGRQDEEAVRAANGEREAPAAAGTASSSASGADPATGLAVVLTDAVEEEAPGDLLTRHIHEFTQRLWEARPAQQAWVGRALGFLENLVPWKPKVFERFGSLTIGWGLPNSDLDVALSIPPRAPLNGNAFLEHALSYLRAATARGDTRLSKVRDARGDQIAQFPSHPIWWGFV